MPDGPARDRPPAVVPQPLEPLQRPRRRYVVEQFVKWTRDHPEQASTRRSLHDLEQRIGVTRKTIGKWFPPQLCGNDPWLALCFTAVDDLNLYGPADPAPDFIRECSNRYAEWRREDIEHREQLTEAARLESLEDGELREIIERAKDLETVTLAARILTSNRHRKLAEMSFLKSHIQNREDAIAIARDITSIARPVIYRVWNARSRLSDDTRRHCIDIVEAAVDSHRVRARDLGNEANEMARIHDLRSKDLDITSSVRPKSDVALNVYFRDTAWAYFEDGEEHVLEAEISATERLLDELISMKAKVYGAEGYSVRSGRENSIEADRLIHVITQVACHLVAHHEQDELHARATTCADRILKLYSPSASLDRRDAATLIGAAQPHARWTAEPLEALRIVKFRGVGEVLIARFLYGIATTAYEPDDMPPAVRLFFGSESDTGRRRTLALYRAVGLYQRAIGWLRTTGSTGAVLRRAIQEHSAAVDALAAQPNNTHPKTRVSEILEKIDSLRADLNAQIVAGFLEVPINSWEELHDRAAKHAAGQLIRDYNEVWRYLKKPELGLRTDLPPRQEG